MSRSSSRWAPPGLSRSLRLAKRGLTDPASALEYMKKKYEKRKLDAKYGIYRRRKGIPRQKEYIHRLLQQEEFVLVILDSCRYDAFEDLYDEYLSGSLDRVWSSGNWTQKWMSRTWDGDYDLTYVSTTPYTFDYAHREYDAQFTPSERFENVVNVIGSEWNPVLSTTPPEPVTDTALQHVADADTTRVVVHYMQPHEPYIGETKILQWDISEEKTQRLLEHVEGGTDDLDGNPDEDTDVDGSEDALTVTELVRRDLDYRQERQITRANHESIDSQLRNGKVSEREVHRAYRDNLEHVLSEVQRLVSYLDCPVVVTADHGEHLGNHFDEVPRYTHPDWTHPVLREVPWFVVGDRSKGQKALADRESPGRDVERDSEVGEETISDRLEALGYK